MTLPNRPSQATSRLRTLASTANPLHRQMDDVAIAREAHHELLPLVQRLKAMIARPGRLLAAVVLGSDSVSVSDGATLTDEHRLLLRKKVAAFQRAELRGLANAWPRFVALASSAGPANAYLTRVDDMMMKLALFYMRLWSHVCAVCVDAAFRMRVVALEAQKQWLAELHPEQRRAPRGFAAALFEAQSLDALSHGRVLAPPSGAAAGGSSAALAKRSRLARHSNEFMRGWFLAHKANPYPSAEERAQIADKTGLTEQQVRNWFANMRKRHWKPSRLNAKKPRCLLDLVLRKHEV
ncbi:hypothetical protein PybrP1_001486 [[Pythium] brassicae (nom. inval.)]|nr:hypothetical protein PybrP1_001486 [[Pythium] brassicae (nom. inval.)]